jgi:hypothetical protein
MLVSVTGNEYTRENVEAALGEHISEWQAGLLSNPGFPEPKVTHRRQRVSDENLDRVLRIRSEQRRSNRMGKRALALLISPFAGHPRKLTDHYVNHYSNECFWSTHTDVNWLATFPRTRVIILYPMHALAEGLWRASTEKSTPIKQLETMSVKLPNITRSLMTIVAYESMFIKRYGRLKQAAAQEGLWLSPTRVYGAIHMCFLYVERGRAQQHHEEAEIFATTVCTDHKMAHSIAHKHESMLICKTCPLLP